MSLLHRIDAGGAKRGAVVFVHGLGGRPYSTWGGDDAAKGGPLFWPSWVAGECPDLAVYTLDYEAEPLAWFGRSMRVPDRGEEVLARLSDTRGLLDLPLAFVCHSLGGLVVKQVIARAQMQEHAILDRIRQVIFLATPHAGSRIPVLASYALGALPTLTMRDLEDGAQTQHNLRQSYRGFCDETERAIETRVFREGYQTVFFTRWGWSQRKWVVTAESSEAGVANPRAAPAIVDADHMEITKPKARADSDAIYRTIYPPILALLRTLPEHPTNRIADAVPTGWAEGEQLRWFTHLHHGNGLPATPNRFIARGTELAMLDAAWASKTPRVLALIASGGTGKTALTREWIDNHLLRLPKDQQPEAIIAWSFDSQGTSEKRQGSSDDFLAAALTRLGQPVPRDASAKAAALAKLLAKRRVLLVLDGIEPLQAAGERIDRHGTFRDKGLPQLLDELKLNNAGLCLVTSRLTLADYANAPAPDVRQERLQNLTLSEAVEVLRSFGIDYPPEQMEALALEHGQQVAAADGGTEPRCHAKTVALIGAFIKNRFPDLRFAPTRAELDAAFAVPDDLFEKPLDPDDPDTQTFRMLRRFEKIYADELARHKEAKELGAHAGRAATGAAAHPRPVRPAGRMGRGDGGADSRRPSPASPTSSAT